MPVYPGAPQFHHGYVSRGPPIIPDSRFSQVRFGTLAFLPWVFPARRGLSADSHTPRLSWFAPGLVPSHAKAQLGTVSERPADDGTTKYPESLCLMLALPSSGRREPSPARTLLLGHRSYRLMRPSSLALLSFGHSLVQGVFAGCDQPLLPTGCSRRYLCESFLGCSVPCDGGFPGCICLFLPPGSSAFPSYKLGRLPALIC